MLFSPMRIRDLSPLLLLAGPLAGQTAKILAPEDMFRRNVGTREQQYKQFPPHKIIGSIYYVGTEALGSFLINTPEGLILINSDYEGVVPVIRKSVEDLGFKFSDIKILLGSHAHADHMEGDALVKELTGARVMAMAEDARKDATGRQAASDRSDLTRWRYGNAGWHDAGGASDTGAH